MRLNQETSAELGRRLTFPWHASHDDRDAALTVAAGGREAFPLILRRIREAQRSIDIRAYIWRDDDTGRALARALVEAAERGVRVRISKDRDAASYEYYELGGRSFFHPEMRLYDHVESAFLAFSYEQRRVRRRRGPTPERAALLGHPGISVRHETRRYDHAKVYVFDDETMILGGINIGDDAHHHALDFMVEVQGAGLVHRYRERKAGRVAFDPARRVDFLLHDRATHGVGHSPLRRERLALIGAARESLVVEMAYFGDDEFLDALIAASDRGVRTTVITARRAAILRHLNHAAIDRLLRETRSPDHLDVWLLDHDVHSKVVIVDAESVDLGSANFSPLSHGFYDELNVHLRDRAVAQEIQAELLDHRAFGQRVRGGLPHIRPFAKIERFLMQNHVDAAFKRPPQLPRR